jgi:Predicted Zn-dependent peptidases, insulinase-like
MNLANLATYTLIKEETIEDIKSKGYLLRHNKSGARIMLIANNDENKVFHIAFRTPPADSTGVAHILEHSVLCGSKKYPVKDPFVELAKGSLNTFLNAMTYPDKTMYPVASCNEQDFQNLMNVYLDAVFCPNIYQHEEIFKQEGWHYELNSEEEPIVYNGVVYNEMKGAFSSADDMVDREIFNSLFPDNAYGVESGGDPDYITDLTYEQFLTFHNKYYHPSNSYIYLYGDVAMEEKLAWLDEAYLSKFDKIAIDSAITLQKPFKEPIDKTLSYPILENESLEDNTYLTYNIVVGNSLDTELNMAFHVLEYALLASPGAPLKQALLDAKIGSDVSGSYEDDIYQPFFSIVAKKANLKDKERFLAIIKETLEQIAREGINKKALKAALNGSEFRFREADYAPYPTGLMYGIDVMSSWLYDENKPFAYLQQLDVFRSLSDKIDSDYFEELIRKYFLNNTHEAVVVALPEKGLTLKKEEAIAKHLAEYKATLSKAEIETLIVETKALAKYQEAPESKAALESIPLLKRSDIRRKAAKIYNEQRTAGELPVIYHKLDTNKIAYLSLLFDTKEVPQDLLGYLGILKAMLGYVDTKNYSYSELFNEINANSGGISCDIQLFEDLQVDDNYQSFFCIKSKCLYEQLPFVTKMIKEIISESQFTDEKRLYEIIAQMKSRMQGSLMNSGHATAVSRLASYYSKLGWVKEEIRGIAFYRLLDKLESEFATRKEKLIGNLAKLVEIIFTKNNILVSYTADEEGFDLLCQETTMITSSLYPYQASNNQLTIKPEKKNEAFKTSGQVQYNAVGGNYKQVGYQYKGSMKILRTILSYDYLWANLRVKGGAYGCMSAFNRSGEMYFVSYRDPNLTNTFEVYNNIADYVRKFSADERELTKYIIGTMSSIDSPLTPPLKGSMSLSAYLMGLSEADLQKERDEILDATQEDIRVLAELIAAVLNEGYLCTVGSESVIDEHAEFFNKVTNLIGSND